MQTSLFRCIPPVAVMLWQRAGSIPRPFWSSSRGSSHAHASARGPPDQSMQQRSLTWSELHMELMDRQREGASCLPVEELKLVCSHVPGDTDDHPAREAALSCLSHILVQSSPGWSVKQRVAGALLAVQCSGQGRSDGSPGSPEQTLLRRPSQPWDRPVHRELIETAAALMDQATGHMGLLDAVDLVDLVWSRAALAQSVGGTTSDDNWDELTAALMRQLGSLTGTSISTILWASASLKAALNPSLGGALLDGLEPCLAVMGPRELSEVMWAIAELQIRPSRSWSHRYLSAVEAQLHLVRRGQIVSVLISLARANVQTPPSTCNRLAVVCVSHLEGMSATHVSWIFWALGKLRAPIKWTVLSPLVDHYKTLVPFASGTELAAVVSALSSISCYPTAPKQLVNHKKYFLMALAHRSCKILPSCSPRQLVQLISGFNRLGYYPGAMWMKLHREACISRQEEFDDLSKQRVRRAYQLLLTRE